MTNLATVGGGAGAGRVTEGGTYNGADSSVLVTLILGKSKHTWSALDC